MWGSFGMDVRMLGTTDIEVGFVRVSAIDAESR
jgi:hypothetical protein